MAANKRQHSDTVQSVLDAAKAAAEGDIPPPPHVKLREGDAPFWSAIVRARSRREWTDADLINAANMARAMADIERIQAEIDVEGDVVENTRGTQIVNPRHTLIEQLSRRIMALQRLLGMQAVAVNGNARDQAKSRENERVAREAKDSLEAEDDLIPMR